MAIRWEYRLLHVPFFCDPPKIKNCMAKCTLKYFLTQDHMGWKFQKATATVFRPVSIEHHEDIGYHGGIRAVTFLGNRPSFKTFVAL